LIREKLPQAGRIAEPELQHAPVRADTRQPINRIAAIRQSQSRWYSTRKAINDTVRHFSSTTLGATKPTRSSYHSSRVGQAVNRLTFRAPFASTLRPNLTGGILPRSAGGYGTGAGRIGGARYFSHTPAAPAQVVNNVSQAVRAFWLSGQKAQFDGINPRGEKRYRPVTALQEETGRKIRTARPWSPGSYLDFKVTPTITALGPLSSIPRTHFDDQSQYSLNCEGLLDVLSVDFARALKDLAAIMNDLKRLSSLGDLPISLPHPSTLRVRFPGCDADTVECLCQELGIRRGLVYQDADFDSYNGTEMALLFPFASSKTPSEVTFFPKACPTKPQEGEQLEWAEMISARPSPRYSTRSITSHDFEEIENAEANPWVRSPSGYSSLHASDEGDVAGYFQPAPEPVHQASEYEGLEGVYKFLEECDRAMR
jgi:hypothetical protein